MTVQDGEDLAGRPVPQAKRPVLGGGHEALAVRAKGDLVDPPRVSAQSRNRLPGCPVPEAHGLVPGGGGDPRAVVAAGDEDGRIAMTRHGGDRWRLTHLPQPQGTVWIVRS